MAVFGNLRAALRPSLAALTLVVAAGTAHAAGDPLGVWINDTGRGAVEIKRCGKGLCGHVVWVKDGKDAKGCGKQIIGNATPAGSGTWDGGWIYSPEKRKTYDVELKPLANGTLRVTGYAGVRFLSKTMIWTRAPADLKRCGQTTIEAKVEPKAPDVKPTSPEATEAKAPVAAVSEAKSEPSATSPAPQLPSKPEEAKQATAAVSEPAPQAAPAPLPSASPPAAAAPPTSASPGAAEETAAPASPDKGAETEAKAEPPATSEKEDQTATGTGTDDDEVVDNGPPTPKEKSKLALGNLDLDKVLTRTKSGRCKLDLPFVKVQFDCNRD